MARKAVLGSLVVAISLAFMTLASRSEAVLGCSTGLPAFATCDSDRDCDPVGGIGCTQGICGCIDQDAVPCPCLQIRPPNPAPTLSHVGLIVLIAMLGALGALHVRRNRASLGVPR